MCFFFRQKTAYEMRMSDWSSDVCSSDLHFDRQPRALRHCGWKRLDQRLGPVHKGDDATLARDEDGRQPPFGDSTGPKTRVVTLHNCFDDLPMLDQDSARLADAMLDQPLSQADRKSTRLNSSH